MIKSSLVAQESYWCLPYARFSSKICEYAQHTRPGAGVVKKLKSMEDSNGFLNLNGFLTYCILLLSTASTHSMTDSWNS